MSQKKKVYLAGFDVFCQDAKRYGEYLVYLCEKAGFDGVFPLDNQVPQWVIDLGNRAQIASWIYRANMKEVRGCNAVLANLNDFRTPGLVDDGTAWEIGFASALSKPIYGYTTDPRTMIERIPTHLTLDTRAICSKGYEIENFGMLSNLMIACSCHTTIGGPADALAVMAMDLIRP